MFRDAAWFLELVGVPLGGEGGGGGGGGGGEKGERDGERGREEKTKTVEE